MESPCIQVCVVDAATRACIGCGRTIEQIAGWTGFSASERRRIMSELSTRKIPQPTEGVVP
ncbi:MAG: DUF1289 domain-containing protein [Hyphomicrobiaceae bacterium]